MHSRTETRTPIGDHVYRESMDLEDMLHHKLGRLLGRSNVGQSQSAAVVTAYLVKCHKMNFGDAYAKLQQLKPDLLCPKCTSKLGSLYWCGEQCSCSRWVTPAFLMHKNRVDEIKHISIATRSGTRIK
uniref:dual specificity protein phosphatase 12-like n=1 Tax=Oncorhynchus gorbuscha TaxID=8017 RepID=UPI001EAF22DB|nr:dual specificity protein phosphatase 12-like [Oncorhynchus gorbuscha]